MAQQTAVEWLEQILREHIEYKPTLEIQTIRKKIEKAKEMHKKEIIDAYYQCGKDNFEHIKVINKSATEYYQETFVSKGSDEHIVDTNEMVDVPQQEISDEEIEKACLEHFPEEYVDMWSERLAFKLACKWYREQLKQRQ